jgi:hypothetical protein
LEMDYPLAKALKDAGFPQEGKGRWIVDPNLIVARREDRAYIPTLEELIEACGNERIIVEIVEGRLKVLNTDNVARLWLALS